MVAVWRCGHLKSTCTCEFVPSIRSIDIFHISDRVQVYIYRSCEFVPSIVSTQCSVDMIDVHWICIEFALANSVTEPV